MCQTHTHICKNTTVLVLKVPVSQILKLILVGIFNTMFDLKSVFVFLVLKIHVLRYFSYIVGISVCLKNLDFGPELTFDPEHFLQLYEQV